MARHKDGNWQLPEGPTATYDVIKVAVLMDIRDELKKMNAILNCPNFLDIPNVLLTIRRNTTKRKYVRKVKA